MIGQTIAQYHITDQIGAGGMGEVYLAEDTRLKRKVALKFLPTHINRDPEVRARFQREAQALAALNHPNIVSVHDVTEHEGRPFIVMEYVEGRPLKEIIRDGDVSIERIVTIATQITEGLAAAHEEKIVHRDIKSDNIVVSNKGRVKIMDFGLATWRGVAQLTKEGSTVGTIAYMSPEQAQGRDVDQRTDLWSLGVILYEMITGHLPFKGDHDAAIQFSIASEAPEPLARYRAGVPEALQQIVDKCLEKDPDTRYQSATGLLPDLRRLKRDSDSRLSVSRLSVQTQAAPSTPAPKSRKGLIASVSVAAVIVLALLVFRPWDVQVQSTKEAAAVENRLAVMYFDNVADPGDPQRLGEIATNLLITDLSGSQHVDVVSSQRLYDLLKLLGHEGEKTVSPDIATQVAKKAGARWMMMGSILRAEPNMVVTAQIVDVESGSTVASQRITGEPGQDIFPLVDQLTRQVKKGLSLPTDADGDRPVAVATTTSRDAYRLYLEGIDLFEQLLFDQAADKFREVIAIDSTFAMAYYRAALSISNFGTEEARQYIDNAVALMDHVSYKDQLYIQAMAAGVRSDAETTKRYYEQLIREYPDEKLAQYQYGVINGLWFNDQAASIEHLTRAIEIDPMYKLPYNNLAYAYNHIGDFDKSIWAINKYIELAPDEPNPYDTRADLYAYNGKLHEALASYQKAFEINPDFYLSRLKWAHMHSFLGQYAVADSIYTLELSNENPRRRAVARHNKATIFVAQGRIHDAINYLEKAVSADELDGQFASARNKEVHIAWYNALLGDTSRTLDVLRESMGKVDSATGWEFGWLKLYEVKLLAAQSLNGQAESAERELEVFRTKSDPSIHKLPVLADAWIALAKNDYPTAVAKADTLLSIDRSYFERRMAGIIYLRANEISRAVSVFEDLAKFFDPNRAWEMDHTIYYDLGLAYEKSGWNDKAVAEYKRFLDLWGNGDTELVSVRDARARLSRLKSRS